MWAITSYFNPLGSRRRLSNYRPFRANLTIPLVTVELSFNGVFELEKNDADILIQLSGAALLWQKERLLNLALKAVPTDVEHIAWLDCDVILKRKDWAAEAKKQLQELNVVQLFSEAVFLNPDDDIQRIRVRDGYSYIPGLMSLADAKDLIQIGSHHRKESGQICARACLGSATKHFRKPWLLRRGYCWKRRLVHRRCAAWPARVAIKTLFAQGASSTALF